MIPPDITMKEKKAILANDAKVREGSTYFHQAQASADDLAGGRFGVAGSKQMVTGSSPLAWPKMPEGNFWAKNEMPPEPTIDGRSEGLTLGFEIDRPDAALSSTVAASAVEDTPTPASSESHVITNLGVGRIAPGFRRRF
jgi:hypothetical protein